MGFKIFYFKIFSFKNILSIEMIFISLSYMKIFFFLLPFIIVYNGILFMTKKCNLLLIFPSNRKNGPGNFAYYINESLYDWNKSEYSKYCNITLLNYISLININRFLSHANSYIWFQSAIYLFSEEINYKKVLYGPNLSPINYFKFPLNNTHEIKWIEIINKIRYYVVHHRRISYHLMNRTKSYYQINKYLTFPCCIKYKKNLTILKWEERKYDFLVYIKYNDLDHRKDGNKLINSLNSSYKVVTFYYGSFKKEELVEAAGDSKIVIYFSFYDTGAIALLEMQRMGVFTVTLQKEFITKKNGMYIPELQNDVENAIRKIKDVIKIKFDSKFIAEYNRKKSDCKNYIYKLVTKL